MDPIFSNHKVFFVAPADSLPVLSVFGFQWQGNEYNEFMKGKKRAGRWIVLIIVIVLVVAGVIWKRLPEYRYRPTESFESERSEAVLQMISRAKALESVEWTPLKDVAGWKNWMTYQAEETYHGLPYGQPIDAKYVPWDASMEEFLMAVSDPDSLLYTSNASAIAIAPYYSIDCSAFVSWAWGLPSRQTTWTIPQFADLISTENYANAQIGDVLNGENHVVLITDIERDETGTIIAMEISEASPKSLSNPNGTVHTTRYGRGSLYSLEEIQLRYFNRGFALYRKRNRDSF